MQHPSFLPNHLTSIEFTDESQLFQLLIPQIDDLLLFFQAACDDEKWALQHSRFIRLVLRWMTKQYFLRRLSYYDVKRFVAVIQSHYSLLRPFLFFQPALFFTLKWRVDSHIVLINSLLFGVGCPFLGSIFQRECFEHLNDEWHPPRMRISVFHIIESYLYTGQSQDLWKNSHDEIIEAMSYAKQWGLDELVKECVTRLKMDIHQDNVVETIIKAHQQGFEVWKEEAYAFFNDQKWGLRFHSGNPSELKIEFLDFQPETFQIFHLFTPWVTHVAFRGHLSEGSDYQTILGLCPNLIGVDLSESNDYADQFIALPPYLLDLGLSGCNWLQPHHLRQVAAQCPHLKRLELMNNRHFNHLAWGELHRFKELKELNLAGCTQLTNENLKLIGQALSLLSDLNIAECRKINDEGIAALVELTPSLLELNVNHCDELSDRALREIGVRLRLLTHLQIKYCEGFTDQGLLQLIKLRPTLTTLHIKGCSFSLQVLESIQKSFPLLKISYI